ncbi:MAG: serine hydrolase [Proteobacteria bacterium]|nr:serine hydrolase [Pseudomonadota bacterium]
MRLPVRLLCLALLSAHAAADPYPHANEPIGGVRELYSGALTPDLAVATARNIDRLFATRTIRRGSHVRPLPPAARPLGPVRFRSRGRDWDLVDYLAVNRVASLLVLKNGEVALELYQYGNTPATRWMSMSVAKSVTATLIGAALQQGRLHSLDDDLTRYLPQFRGTAYEGVTVRDLLLMSSGVRWDETYTSPASDRRALLEAQIAQRPGAALELMRRLPRAAPPGTVNNYNTGETMVAGAVLAAATGQHVADYLSERIWARVGMESDATWWLDAPNGLEVAGSGIAATLRDYGRFALFCLDDGVVNGEHLLPPGWMQEAGSRKALKGGQMLDYGYYWWPAVATEATPDPEGAYLAEGIFGQYLYLNPREHVVVVALSARSKPEGMDVIDDLDFFAAVARALR